MSANTVLWGPLARITGLLISGILSNAMFIQIMFASWLQIYVRQEEEEEEEEEEDVASPPDWDEWTPHSHPGEVVLATEEEEKEKMGT